jgi:hypothetical protein
MSEAAFYFLLINKMPVNVYTINKIFYGFPHLEKFINV